MSDNEIFTTPEIGAHRRVSFPALPRECRECGKPYTAKREESLYCCAQCRTDFTNRRFTRGAILYDLYMAYRFERDEARQKKVFRAIHRLCSDWRQEDKEKRGGRKSWGDWREYLAQNVHLMNVRLGMIFGRKRG